MQSGWLEDLIAIAESDTLTEAAERRHSSQPAFSRRIQSIEHWLGTAVIDRDCRPIRLIDAAFRKLPEIRSILQRVSELRASIASDGGANTPVVIATLHSIACGIFPSLLASLKRSSPDVTTRLIAGERDDCYALLMTRQASMLVAYEAERMPIAEGETLVEKQVLFYDTLLPVGTPELVRQIAKARNRSLPLINNPAGTFFGSLILRDLLPKIGHRYDIQVVIETIFVPAALEFALAGLGVTWAPESLVGRNIERGELRSLEKELGGVSISVVAARREGIGGRSVEQVWRGAAKFGEAWAGEQALQKAHANSSGNGTNRRTTPGA